MKKNDLEIWKKIEHSTYEISSLGRLRNNYKNGKTKIVAPSSNGQKENDYQFYKIEGKKHYIHILVLENFVGPKPSGLECDHIDGNPNNNKLENLQYLEASINRSHKGEKHGMAKLSDKVVKAIKKLSHQGYYQRDIAELFEVSRSTISSIITGRTWSHII